MHVKYLVNIQQMLAVIILPIKGAYEQKRITKGLWQSQMGIAQPQVDM